MRKTIVFVVAMLFINQARATTYDIHVTRKGQDLYAIVDQGNVLYIQTAYCYEYATDEEAILVLNITPFDGSIDIGKLVFTDSGTSCQVNTILQ